jgi:hypothetical protein
MEPENLPDKRESIQYYDLFFGLSNSFVMSFMIFLIPKYIILVILAYVFTFLIAGGMIYIFQKKILFMHFLRLEL